MIHFQKSPQHVRTKRQSKLFHEFICRGSLRLIHTMLQPATDSYVANN